jgi:hypothetical protein
VVRAPFFKEVNRVMALENLIFVPLEVAEKL